MGDSKRRNGSSIPHHLMPAMRPPPQLAMTTELTAKIVPKLEVLVLPAKRIRRVPAPGALVVSDGEKPPEVVEVHAKRMRKNTETGQVVSDPVADWHPLEPGRIAWAKEELDKLPIELCDVVGKVLSCCYNPTVVDRNGNPRRSVIEVEGLELYRIDALTLQGAHLNQFAGRAANDYGRREEPPAAEEKPEESPPAPLVTP